MATETLLDLLERERTLLNRKREAEFNIMKLQHRKEEAECFPEFCAIPFGRNDNPEDLMKQINECFKELTDICQSLPEIQVKIKDAIEAYKNAEFVSGVVFDSEM